MIFNCHLVRVVYGLEKLIILNRIQTVTVIFFLFRFSFFLLSQNFAYLARITTTPQVFGFFQTFSFLGNCFFLLLQFFFYLATTISGK